jgi:aryl-alcohol dehydrogenase-like predicted oxidoreductase
MEFRQLGHSGIAVSVFSLGSWLTYEFMEEQDVLAVIGSGLAAGINFLDDARYDDRTGRAPRATGCSEVVFGRLLRKGGWNRADLIIANKLWFEFYPEQSPKRNWKAPYCVYIWIIWISSTAPHPLIPCR